MPATFPAEAAAMEFRILGPMETVHRGATVASSGQRKCALLARLVLEANRTVSVDGLVDSLWGDSPPATAVKMVHIYVSHLRKALPAGLLKTRAPGYVLEVAPDSVDVLRFTRLRDEARAAVAAGDVGQGADTLREALALWRGPALAEFTEPFALVEGAHLEELRLTAIEERIDADLALGRHAELVAELRSLAAAHPLRHRPRAQLMLALYRAGRHAEALAAYQEFQQALRDELGIEPPAGLRELQFNILNQDPRLDLAPAAAPAPAVRIVTRPATADGLVGRVHELAQLDAALERAVAGHGTTALLHGPAGIGKTRLACELANRARAAGATVLAGRCIDMVGAALPFAPLAEALRPLHATPAVTGLGEVARLLPGAAAPSSDATAAAGDARLRLFSEVLAALERAAQAGTVVLMLEDLHWADGSTLDLLGFLAHSVAGRRILILGTWRPAAGEPDDDDVRRLGSALARGGLADVVELGPLAREEIEALVERGSGAPLPAAVADGVCARAEGNPFFAQELLAAALRGEDALPRVLRDVLLADFGRLCPHSRAVARVAAAARRAVTHRLVMAAAGLPEDDVVEALRGAVDHGVLVADHRNATYRFRHALIAEAVYGTLLPGEREAVHERLAGALAREPELAATGAVAAELAEHWLAAGRLAEALTASLRAAREAQAVSGLSEALRHLERVLDLWDDVPRAQELTGVAMPALLAWAADLAGTGDRAGTGIAVAEARELYPLAVVLESIAIRRSPPLRAEALGALRAANARLRAAAHDPVAASAADDEFHRHLVAGCGDAPLLDALRPLKRALLRYEHVYMDDPARIERSASQHDAIVEALARGDHCEAAQRLRRNLTSGLPDLTPELER